MNAREKHEMTRKPVKNFLVYFARLLQDTTQCHFEAKRTAADTLKDGKSIVKRERTRLKEAVDAGVNTYKKEKASKGKKS